MEGRYSEIASSRTLYELSVAAVAEKFLRFKKHLTFLPDSVLFDIYYQVRHHPLFFILQ